MGRDRELVRAEQHDTRDLRLAGQERGELVGRDQDRGARVGRLELACERLGARQPVRACDEDDGCSVLERQRSGSLGGASHAVNDAAPSVGMRDPRASECAEERDEIVFLL